MRARDRRCLFPPETRIGAPPARLARLLGWSRRPAPRGAPCAGGSGRDSGPDTGLQDVGTGLERETRCSRGEEGPCEDSKTAPALERRRPGLTDSDPRAALPAPSGPRVAAPAAWTRRGLRAGASPLGHPRSRPHRPSDPSREGRGQRKVTPPEQSAGSATARPPVVTVRPAHARPRGVSVAPAFLHTEASAHTATAAPGPAAPQAPPSPLLRAPVPTAGSSLGCTLDPRVLRPGARRGHQASRPTGSRDPHGGGPGGSVTLFGGSGSLVRSVTVTLVPRPGRTAPAHGPCVGPSPVC